jgi:hypothetical protein
MTTAFSKEQKVRQELKSFDELKYKIATETVDIGILGSSRVKHGSTPIMTSNETRDLWNVPSVQSRTFLNSGGEQLSVVSSSADDNIIGSGVGVITLVGLDVDCNMLSETIFLSGTTPVVTSNTFDFVNYAFVTKVASTGNTNAGNISISGNTSGNIQLYIEIGDGLSRSSHVKTPRDYTLFITESISNIENVSSAGTKGARFKIKTITPEGTLITLKKWGQQTNGTGLENPIFSLPLKVPAEAILYGEVTSLQSSSIMNLDLYYMAVAGNYAGTLAI